MMKAQAIYAALYEELKAEVPELPAAFPLDEIGFRAVLDPAHIVAGRAVAGGPQAMELAKLFASVEKELKVRTGDVTALAEQLAAAQTRLNDDFEKLIRE